VVPIVTARNFEVHAVCTSQKDRLESDTRHGCVFCRQFVSATFSEGNVMRPKRGSCSACISPRATALTDLPSVSIKNYPSMRANARTIFLALILCTGVFCYRFCVAQDIDREKKILKLEEIQFEGSLGKAFKTAAPLALAQARSENPGVSPEIWSRVETQVSQGEVDVFTRPGGFLDVSVRRSTETLSDSELSHLISLLSDPVYEKYRVLSSQSLSSSELQRFMQAINSDTVALINSVLTRNRLHPIRQQR
jgi:hypothetical protein